MRAVFGRQRTVLPALLLLIATVAVLSACAPARGAASAPAASADAGTTKVTVEGGSYTDVTPAGLAAMLKNKDFPLINVHIPYEGEIEGTDLFIPYNEIEANLNKLPADRGARIVLYCRSGSMAATASRTLVRLGYTNVWNLNGGMIAWEQAGYKLKK